MNVATNYVNRIVQTVNYLFEVNEEGDGGGHTEIIRLLKPSTKMTNVETRQLVLNDLLRTRQLSITDASIELARQLRERGVAPTEVHDEDALVRFACAPYERISQKVSDPDVLVDRSFLRLSNYLRQMRVSDVGRHSRVFDYFIPKSAIPRGRSAKAPETGAHPEHVVPCAYIRDLAIAHFKDAKNADDAATINAAVNTLVPSLKRWLVIVDLSDEERKQLDEGDDPLKDHMPANWNAEGGCVFQRLHEKGIAFGVHGKWRNVAQCRCA
jgi:hypothetical protein